MIWQKKALIRYKKSVINNYFFFALLPKFSKNIYPHETRKKSISGAIFYTLSWKMTLSAFESLQWLCNITCYFLSCFFFFFILLQLLTYHSPSYFVSITWNMTNQNGKVKTKEGRYVIMYTRIRIFYYQKGSLAGMYLYYSTYSYK